VTSGAYCKFCGGCCFAYRVIPDGPNKGWADHMATCTDGSVLDLEVLGHTHLTAVDPTTEPQAAHAIAAAQRHRRPHPRRRSWR
jgi:hypothetical protein